MKRYLKILWAMIKFSIARMAVNPINFWASFVIPIIWQAITLGITLTVSNKFGVIAGWTVKDLLVLVSTWGLVNGFLNFWCFLSLTRLPLKINSGELDYILTKPVNSLFLSSFSQFGVNNFLNGVSWLLVILIVARGFSLLAFVEFIIACLLSMLMQYSIWILVVTITFYSGRLDETFDLIYSIRNSSRYPMAAYNKTPWAFRWLAIPFVLSSMVPAGILLGKIGINIILIYIAIVIGTTIIAFVFWNTSLKHYSSASS